MDTLRWYQNLSKKYDESGNVIAGEPVFNKQRKPRKPKDPDVTYFKDIDRLREKHK